MNVIDSSAWLEYFAGSKYAKYFEKIIVNVDYLIVPSITIYEVFKKVMSEQNEDSALQVIAHMKQGRVVDLDLELSLFAAKLSKKYKLPMADSIILATAQKYKADVWTLDSDFDGIEGVNYFKKI